MALKTLDSVLDHVNQNSKAVDSEPSTLRPFLEELSRAGGVDFGLSTSAEALAGQAAVIKALATNCLSSAFVTWSHHMTIEYIDRWGNEYLRAQYLTQLSSGQRIGSTALATALADKSGKELLPITFDRLGESFVINGVIPWASNLHDDTLVVFAARNPNTEQRVLFALTLDTVGVLVKPAGELLALNATTSGTVTFENVIVTEKNLLTTETDEFLAQMRPRFLVLQTAFILGLVSASLKAISVAPSLAPFADDFREFERKFEELTQTHIRLAANLESYPLPANQKNPLPYLELRLTAAELAQAVTRVELATIGGRGYFKASETSRRIRESLFLSVQAPTEGSLRWEISQLKSKG
jgi:alkylation response protein AidB-like acyl-CoA dehydrogenase